MVTISDVHDEANPRGAVADPKAVSKRQLLAILAALFACVSLDARAQVPPNARRIAYLGSVAEAADKGLLEEFRRALRSFGYIEGQNLVIDSRRELDPARLAGLGGDLARL